MNVFQLYSSAAGLKHHITGRVIPAGRAIASPLADAMWTGVPCLRKMASAVWGMTQHIDPGSCSFSSLPRATSCRLSSCISSPLCSPSARAQGKWLQMSFVHWPFKRLSASSHLSLVDRNPAALYSHILFGFLSQFWFCRLENPGWG